MLNRIVLSPITVNHKKRNAVENVVIIDFYRYYYYK